jgi:hypothetical protein
MKLKRRTPKTDTMLDGVLAALRDEGFIVPEETPDEQRDALMRALMRAHLDHEVRVRLDDA